MKKYEVYDCNDEVIESYDSFSDALIELEYSNGKFILDTTTNEVVFGDDTRKTKDGVYYIENTISEFSKAIKGYFPTEDDAREALSECHNWFRPNGTGTIWFKEFGLDGKTIEIYNVD